MKDLARGFRRFRRDVFPAQAALFARLATTHQPDVLFVGCADSRVIPELITQRGPGDMFVIRTAGNLVPSYDSYDSCADGVTASIEYAVGVLGVTDVIVCGHSDCGAMTALACENGLDGLPAMATWLRHAEAPKARLHATRGCTSTDRVNALVRDNVMRQLANLQTHPAVAQALAQNTMTLHGWVYDIASGCIDELDAGTGRFAALAG
ncbi:carbonic anhydrase [Streptomyces sp. NPDC058086]|uniref:carbonic anhydrase n=1 Tax=Streptomyces sp. NPDC058086 TaxID=3346334 RepID=UPI0036E9FC12